MIKLGGLIDLRPQWLGEADVYTATSKETGTTSVFKSKAARAVSYTHLTLPTKA